MAGIQTIIPTFHDLFYLFILSLCCTVWLYKLEIQVLKKMSAFTVNLTYNLEPVYTIILAMLIFNEAKELNFTFYIGMGLIVMSVILQMIAVKRESSRELAVVEVNQEGL